MDYSANELLLKPGERKRIPFWNRIIQVALAILIITVCVTLLVAHTVFVTIFVLESFHSNSVGSSNPQHPSIFLRKLITHSNEGDSLQVLVPVQLPKLVTNVPDDLNSKTMHPRIKSEEDYEDIKHRYKNQNIPKL